MTAHGSLRRSGGGLALGYLFRGSFDEVHRLLRGLFGSARWQPMNNFG